MAKLSRDLSVGVLHPRENLFAAGPLGSVNAEIITSCDGASTVSLDLRGTFNLTVELSGSVDGVNWVPIAVRPLNVAAVSYVVAIAGSAAGVWVGKCAPFRLVRARVTAYTSGAAGAVLSASTAALDDSLQGMVTPLIVTAVGAAAAAVTLTLPNPGAGLRQYLTYLSINRFAAAALTAAAAPVTITTTNLPGTLAFSFPADAALQGSIDRWREDFALPIAAAAQGAAVTVVAPATTGVIWRVTAGYYVAP
jgi:hypothetical protein